MPTVGVLQPGVDLLDHLIEAVEVLPFDPRDLVIFVRRFRLDVPADASADDGITDETGELA